MKIDLKSLLTSTTFIFLMAPASFAQDDSQNSAPRDSFSIHWGNNSHDAELSERDKQIIVTNLAQIPENAQITSVSVKNTSVIKDHYYLNLGRSDSLLRAYNIAVIVRDNLIERGFAKNKIHYSYDSTVEESTISLQKSAIEIAFAKPIKISLAVPTPEIINMSQTPVTENAPTVEAQTKTQEEIGPMIFRVWNPSNNAELSKNDRKTIWSNLSDIPDVYTISSVSIWNVGLKDKNNDLALSDAASNLRAHTVAKYVSDILSALGFSRGIIYEIHSSAGLEEKDSVPSTIVRIRFANRAEKSTSVPTPEVISVTPLAGIEEAPVTLNADERDKQTILQEEAQNLSPLYSPRPQQKPKSEVASNATPVTIPNVEINPTIPALPENTVETILLKTDEPTKRDGNNDGTKKPTKLKAYGNVVN